MKLSAIMPMGILVMACLAQAVSAQTADGNVTIIELTQTDRQFTTQRLTLRPGKYRFRVVNKDVDKDLGFVIQKASDQDADVAKSAIPNSFTSDYIKMGEAQYTGVVELTEGDYVYSCPLNPTPHYRIEVR